MNGKSIIKYEVFSIIFVAILGSILHFTFDWSGNNLFVGSFSAVNESVWEHLKLIYFPTLITIIIGCYYNKDIIPKYISAKVKGLLIAMSFITIFFYTYTGILGYNISFLDISSFFIAIIICEIITYKSFLSNSSNNFIQYLVILIILFFCFIVFTYNPPKLGLFKDPITNTYGIFKSK